VLAKRVIDQQVARVSRICEQLPEVEIRSRDHHSFLVRGKKFAYYLIDHHGDGRVCLECKADKGVKQLLAESEPETFFLPAYMAHHGWIGIYLDAGKVDWDRVELFLVDAFRLAAPKTLARLI
jgi:phosphoribosylglycinamide formyltransferase-1